MVFTTCVFYLLCGALCLQYSYAVSVTTCLQVACRCPHGTKWVTDSDGCEYCSCLPDPADCPQLMCVEKMCPYGFATNEDNCPTCDCNRGIECSDIILTPDLCPDGTSLTTDEHGCTICQNNTPCPILSCPNICCTNGIRKDSNGCSTCDCNPPKCPEISCPRPEDCPGVQKTEYFTDEQGCLKCSCICPTPICPEIKCAFGLQTNTAGCLICKCKSSDLPQVESPRNSK